MIPQAPHFPFFGPSGNGHPQRIKGAPGLSRGDFALPNKQPFPRKTQEGPEKTMGHCSGPAGTLSRFFREEKTGFPGKAESIHFRKSLADQEMGGLRPPLQVFRIAFGPTIKTSPNGPFGNRFFSLPRKGPGFKVSPA